MQTSLIFPLFWWEKVPEGRGEGAGRLRGGCYLQEVSFPSPPFGVQSCQRPRAQTPPPPPLYGPRPAAGARGKAAPSAATLKEGPLPGTAGDCCLRARRLLPGGGGVPAPQQQQGSGSGFILPRQLLQGELGKGEKVVNETYFCSCDEGCDAAHSWGECSLCVHTPPVLPLPAAGTSG